MGRSHAVGVVRYGLCKAVPSGCEQASITPVRGRLAESGRSE